MYSWPLWMDFCLSRLIAVGSFCTSMKDMSSKYSFPSTSHCAYIACAIALAVNGVTSPSGNSISYSCVSSIGLSDRLATYRITIQVPLLCLYSAVHHPTSLWEHYQYMHIFITFHRCDLLIQIRESSFILVLINIRYILRGIWYTDFFEFGTGKFLP